MCVRLGLILGLTLLSRHHSPSLSIVDKFNAKYYVNLCFIFLPYRHESPEIFESKVDITLHSKVLDTVQVKIVYLFLWPLRPFMFS